MGTGRGVGPMRDALGPGMLAMQLLVPCLVAGGSWYHLVVLHRRSTQRRQQRSEPSRSARPRHVPQRVHDDGVSDSETWVSWEEAARLTGLPVPTVEHAVRVGRINRRTTHGSRPTLDRTSVLEWAAWHRTEAAGKAERRATRGRAKGARTSSRPRAAANWPRLDATGLASGDWLTVAEAADALGCSESSVLRLARAGHLDARSAIRPAGQRPAAVYSSTSVEKVKAERAAEADAWVTWEEAARIVGCSPFPIPALIAEGLLVQRPGPHWKPSISRASAIAAAPVWAKRQRRAARAPR